MIDFCIVNSWTIFHTNTPDSDIKSQRLFHFKLVQPLIDQPLFTKFPWVFAGQKWQKVRK